MTAAGVVLALVLVAANGFFVAVEFGLARLRPTQAAEFARRRRPGAKSVLHAVTHEQGHFEQAPTTEREKGDDGHRAPAG